MNKMLKKLLIAAAAAVLAGTGFLLSRRISDRMLFRKTEQEIYAEMCRLPADRLIRKINRLEKKLPDIESKTVLLPLYDALIDKAEEFSADALIAQIQQKDTHAGIESAFVEMYVRDGYDCTEMLHLLDDPAIAEETKEYIAAHCDFSLDALCDVFRNTDGKTATIAIKRISVQDSQTAMQLVQEFVSAERGSISDEKYISICLGIAQYYEEHDSPEDIAAMKNIYIPMMKTIFENGSSDPVRNQAVYALGRICDYDLFAWLMDNESISDYCKISVIERNYRQMKVWIAEAESEDDIRSVLDAMQIMPTLEIGDALQAAIDAGRLPESAELRALIDRIQAEGIHAVDKYE